MNSSIEELEIASGLKKMLIDAGFTADSILHYGIDEISTVLGIEIYVAKLIFDAAKRFDQTKQRSNFLKDSVVAA
ncbi:MAG TPA: hypothetical protein VH500_10930 [Nitrososphaeraceae archaeon]|jgi:hypothetical protein